MVSDLERQRQTDFLSSVPALGLQSKFQVNQGYIVRGPSLKRETTRNKQTKTLLLFLRASPQALATVPSILLVLCKDGDRSREDRNRIF